MIGTSIIALGSFQSCVDEDYDLSKDMDLVVNVGGGQLSIPASSTEVYTLDRMLDLEEGSSIKAADDNLAALYGLQKGDYLLIQDGSPSNASFDIPAVDLSDLNSGTPHHDQVELPTIPAGVTVPGGRIGIQLGGSQPTDQWIVRLGDFINSFNISESNVNHDIVSINNVVTDVRVDFDLAFSFSGTNYTADVTIAKGFTIDFDETITIALRGENSLNCTVVDGHKIVFNADQSVPATGVTLHIAISGIDFKDSEYGLDAYHNFNYAGKITTTGTLYLDASPGQIPAGSQITMNIKTASNLLQKDDRDYTYKPSIISVTGVVNPTIDVDPISFEINDIPDFLKEGDNKLDIANPQIYLTINNSSEVTVDVNVTLKGSYDKKPNNYKPCNVSFSVDPGDNYICISRIEVTTAGVTKNVIVPELVDLIMTIPNRIDVNVEAAVEQNPVTFRLGDTYNFDFNNEVVVPLAFGKEMSFTYSDTEDGWDADLGEYNFNKAEIHAEIENTAPLSFIADVTPVFTGNNPETVKVTVKGGIARGSVANPGKSELVITVEGTPGKNLKGLDGISYSLKASDPVAGTPLNEAQGLRFSKIYVSIIGGVTVDANEL